MPSLDHDIRQLFAHSVLNRFGRLEDAHIDFSFYPADVYLSAFFETFEIIERGLAPEHEEGLAQYARVFERFVYDKEESVSRRSAAMMSAALYWLSGYSANSLVIARALQEGVDESIGAAQSFLLGLLAREKTVFSGNGHGDLSVMLREYITAGDERALERALTITNSLEDGAFNGGISDEYVAARLLKMVLNRLRDVSLWASLRGRSSASNEYWTRYMRYQIDTAAPLVDLWPSQQTAISKGLLNGTSSIVLRMPTSAGKTRMTELAFINDLFTDPSRRCLYLAPFRALVTEVESHIGGTLTSLGLPVASLYGGSEANELEVELSTIARVLIATPEKMAAVLKLSGGSLSDFGTIVLDEGHLLDSWSRGTSYELQLSLLRPQLTQQSRTIFLSAVLPNADQIAKWLGGSTDSLAMNTWQPTSMRVGVVTWPTNSTGKLSYIAQTGQPLTEQFFVPRLLEEEQWRELNPQTGRLNTHKFPARDNQASIAAALAFQAVKSGPVLIYTMRPDWAESVATRILNRLSLAKPITTNLINSSNEGALIELSEYLKSILGEEAILAKSVAKGFAFHHGQLPQSVRLVIEDEFRRQTIPLLIATNTLAQGVNLPTKTVIVHSLPDSDSPVRDFWNLAGRAGRANRETEGEVIFLMTGSITQRTIRRFLAKDNIESTESRILVFVQELLKRYPMVSPQAIDSLLEDAVNGEKWNHCIRAIDIRLLELIVEDLAEDEVNGILQGLTGGLFATHQLEAREADEREKLKLGIDQLFRLRHERLITRVPQGPRRKRFARAGLSIESCLSIEGAVEEISVSLTEAEDLTRDVFRKIMEIACRTIELANVNTEILTSLGYEWVNLATYEDVFRRGESRFQSLNEAVRFVEDVFCYRVPWVLNGIIRILENSHPWINEEGQVSQQLPPWFKLLPHMMRYGVPTRELVWIMSLGVHDRRLAQWLLDHFSAGRFFPLRSLRQFVEWAIESRAFIIERMSREWPKYFVRQYSGILDRYERINTLLGG